MVNKKILLVDDSMTIIMTVKMILRRGLYDIEIAKDGLEALDKIEKNPPDLILLDIMMPNMDGFETCSTLKSQDHTNNIPVIMVTTRGEDENIQKSFDSGCDDYITKPINASALLSKIQNFLGDE